MEEKIWHLTDGFNELPAREGLKNILRDDMKNYDRAESELGEDIELLNKAMVLYIESIQADRGEACDIIKQLQLDLAAKDKLLERAKATFEPFPVCSDLRSMTQRLREKHSETEISEIKKGFAAHQAKFRKLYKDIEQALTKGAVIK